MILWRQGPELVPPLDRENDLYEQLTVRRVAEIEATESGASGRSADLAGALLSLARAQGSIGKVDLAVENSLRAVELAREGPPQSPFELPAYVDCAAQWLLRSGDYAQAETYALELVEIVGSIDDLGVRAKLTEGALELFVAIRFGAGDLVRAEEAAHRRMAFSDSRRVPVELSGQDRAHLGNVIARVHLGQIRGARGDDDGARRFYDDALDVIDRFYGHQIRDFPAVLAEERSEITELRNAPA